MTDDNVYLFFLLQKDVRDIFTPVQLEVSYGLRETSTHRPSSRTFPPLKPILQQGTGHKNTITNQVITSTNTNQNTITNQVITSTNTNQNTITNQELSSANTNQNTNQY